MIANDNPENRINNLLPEFYRRNREDHRWIHSAEAKVYADQLRNIGQPAVDILMENLRTVEDVAQGQATASLIGMLGEIAVPSVAAAFPDADSARKMTLIEILGKIGAPSVPTLQIALDDDDVDVRLQVCAILRNIGAPAIPALNKALLDPDDEVRFRAANALREIGLPALEALSAALENDLVGVRGIVTIGLGRIGLPALPALEKALKDDDVPVRHQAVAALGPLGEPAIPVLAKSLDDPDKDVRVATVWWLGKIGLAALTPLTQALEDENPDVRIKAVNALSNLGEAALDPLKTVVGDAHTAVRKRAIEVLAPYGDDALDVFAHVLDDEDQTVRHTLITASGEIGTPAIPLLVRAIEDPSGANGKMAIRQLNIIAKQEPGLVLQAIVDELIVRSTSRSADHFNSERTAHTLSTLISSHPRLRLNILSQFANVAYSDSNDVRQRAVAVSRILDASEFAALVKARGKEQPQNVEAIMRELGGPEATAYFAETQGITLAAYRKPLGKLEGIALNRWEELTKSSRRSFSHSLYSGLVFFVAGLVVVGVGLWLLAFSGDQAQMLIGGSASAFTTLGGMLTKFWRQPVESIQQFSAQQARLQAVFIGYMNRVTQIRLVFESHYTTDEIITVEQLQLFQAMLDEAITQAVSKIAD